MLKYVLPRFATDQISNPNWGDRQECTFRSVILSSGPTSPNKSGEFGLCFWEFD
jgi:hypothetical protein